MKSGFGDYWIGKFNETKMDFPKNVEAFDDFEDAQDVAIDLCNQCENRDELESTEEEEIDEFDENMLKWTAQE